MSHSQFHCTGRAYLDMHGLIFETSICYWQDQPGRERAHTERGGGPDVCRARGAEHGARVRRGHGLAGGRAGPPENRPPHKTPARHQAAGGVGGERPEGAGPVSYTHLRAQRGKEEVTETQKERVLWRRPSRKKQRSSGKECNQFKVFPLGGHQGNKY